MEVFQVNEFLEWLKQYISTAINSDTTISKTVVVENAYKQGNEVLTTNVPQIQIQLLDNSEVERYSSFEGENITSIPVQINAYTGQMKIDSILKSAQEASIIFGQKIKNIMSANLLANANENVKRCIRITMSPALPLLDGSKVYMTAVRFNIWIANPYVVRVQPNPPQENNN